MKFFVWFQSGVHQPPKRSVTKRVAELPSLRYGTIGSKASTTGPLRVSLKKHDTIISTKKRSGNYSHKSCERTNRPVSMLMYYAIQLQNNTTFYSYFIFYTRAEICLSCP